MDDGMSFTLVGSIFRRVASAPGSILRGGVVSINVDLQVAKTQTNSTWNFGSLSSQNSP